MIKKNVIIENMMIDVISRFGFEDKRTIKFCSIAEQSKNFTLIKKLYQKLINDNI